ncbi:hypothetical protein [Emticicia soli]|uniref:Uncharacterized protein n=1 Tax=Emticicia soli TaxID=2027878 RepID=A0ABW5J9S8_9BACT
MQKLIIYIILLLPMLATAQTDSVKVSYSEEKVEKFEKTTLIDEYEKAFGNNRVVKSSLRIAFNRTRLSFLPDRSFTPYQNIFRYLDPIFQFEQKIGIDKSLVASISTNTNKKESIWRSDIGLEGRWYYEMKKRVEAGKQQPNITGKYISLKVEANPYRYNPTSPFTAFLIQQGRATFMFRPTSTYSINWGWQFGNNLDFGFSVGLKHGNKAGVSNEELWVNEKVSSEKGITPFISINAQTALGLYLPLKRKSSGNYCDFLQCNYEVKQLFKLNVNNAFYLDRYFQNVKLDVAYERKIGRSPFSINSNAVISALNAFRYTPTGYREIAINEPNVAFTTMIVGTYSPKMSSSQGYNLGLIEQLRYYIGMKNRVSKGKSANNLSGLYIGALANYQLISQRTPWAEASIGPVIYKDSYNELNLGLGIGYQVQTNRHSFMDVSLNFIRQKVSYEDANRNYSNSMFDFSLKLGLAR